MTRYLNWYGRIALLNVPTDDGRTLAELTDGRLPVPVLYRHPGETRPHAGPWTVGEVIRISVFGARFGSRPGAVFGTLRLDLDLLPEHPEGSLYPEVDVDISGFTTSVRPLRIGGPLLAVTLGRTPAWSSLKPVIEVVSDE